MYFSVSAGQLGNGLDEQLSQFMAEHSDTRLIIVDTLQKVREVGGDNYSYANDYEIITRLKKFADSYGICLLLVHHTRKQNSDDKFDMISGTNGFAGAATVVYFTERKTNKRIRQRSKFQAEIQPDQKIYLNRNPESLVWELERTETEIWKLPPEPLLENIAGKIQMKTPNGMAVRQSLLNFSVLI